MPKSKYEIQILVDAEFTESLQDHVYDASINADIDALISSSGGITSVSLMTYAKSTPKVLRKVAKFIKQLNKKHQTHVRSINLNVFNKTEYEEIEREQTERTTEKRLLTPLYEKLP